MMGLIFQCPSRLKLNVSQSLTPFGSGTTIREQDSRTTAVATVRPYATFLELPTTIRGSKRIAKKGSSDTAALLQHQVIFYKFVNLKIQSLRNLSSSLLMHNVVKSSKKSHFHEKDSVSCGLLKRTV